MSVGFKNKARVAKAIGAFLLAGAVSFGLGGCVMSDTITEKIYDSQEDTQVDQTVEPILVNSLDADQTSSDLPKLVNDPKSTSKTETDQNLPVYSPDPSKAKSSEKANKTKYKKGAGNNGETGASVSKDSDSNTQQNASMEKKEKEQKDDGVEQVQASNGDERDEAKDTSKASKPKAKDKGSEKKKGSDKKKATKEARSSSGTGTVYSADEGEDPEIPDNINEVAAVGNNAVIVAMLSMKATDSALLACDENVQKQTKGLLDDKISSAQALWDDNGEKADSLSDENLKKLTKDVVPDLIFVTEDADTITTAQAKALKKQHIDIYYLPALTSAKRIEFAVKTVGQILAKGGVNGAEDIYKNYLDYHDKMVDKYTDLNGGLTGGFDFNAGKKADGSKSMMVTLYIDAWDEEARHTESSKYLDTSKGVALSTLGYGEAPINYYMSAGGVLNNASSSKLRNKSGKAVVWQFIKTLCPFSFSTWSGLKGADYDVCRYSSSSDYTANLTYYTLVGLSGFGLGTEQYPAVVTKSKAIAKLMQETSKGSGDIYYDYPYITDDRSGSFKGLYTSDSHDHYVNGTIGFLINSDSKELESGYEIYTNPKGLAQKNADDTLCSWTDGSVESVLETSWAYYKFRGGKKKDFESDVSDFYSTFYGHTLTKDELSAIEGGVSK